MIVLNDVSQLVVPLHPCLTIYLPHFIINADLCACVHKQCISVSRDLFNTLSSLVEWTACSLWSWHCNEEANWDSELRGLLRTLGMLIILLVSNLYLLPSPKEVSEKIISVIKLVFLSTSTLQFLFSICCFWLLCPLNKIWNNSLECYISALASNVKGKNSGTYSSFLRYCEPILF